MEMKKALSGSFALEVKKLFCYANTLESMDLEDCQITYKEFEIIKDAIYKLERLGLIEPQEMYFEFFKEFYHE